MISEYDCVKANKKIDDQIEKDCDGCIMSVFENGKAFLVEFFDKKGDTIGNGMELVMREDIEFLVKA